MTRRHDWELEDVRASVERADELRGGSDPSYGFHVVVIHGAGGTRSFFMWFAELEELVKCFDLYLPARWAYPEPVPLRMPAGAWEMPFEVPDLSGTALAEWLTAALEGIHWHGLRHRVGWAGPTRSLLTMDTSFCRRVRLTYWGRRFTEQPPSRRERLGLWAQRVIRRRGHDWIPPSRHEDFLRWVHHASY